MPSTIEISDELFEAIRADAEPFFEITPDMVLRRWAVDRGLLDQNRREDGFGGASSNSVVSAARVLRSPTMRSTHKKPKRIIEWFRLFDAQIPTRAWREMLPKVIHILLGKHPEKSDHLCALSCVYRSSAGLTKPQHIPGTTFYLETNYSAEYTLKHAYEMLRTCGYKPEEVLIVKEHYASKDAVNLKG